MLDWTRITIEDRHQHCRITMRNTFDGPDHVIDSTLDDVQQDFTREETVEIERVLHEYNERQKP